MTVEDIRRSHGLTQKQFAGIIGISVKAYYNKVYGIKPWLPVELAKIAEYCDEIEVPVGSSFRIFKIAHNV